MAVTGWGQFLSGPPFVYLRDQQTPTEPQLFELTALRLTRYHGGHLRCDSTELNSSTPVESFDLIQHATSIHLFI